jgi:hypothetical protein
MGFRFMRISNILPRNFYSYILYVLNDIIWEWKLFFHFHLMSNNSLLYFLTEFISVWKGSSPFSGINPFIWTITDR